MTLALVFSLSGLAAAKESGPQDDDKPEVKILDKSQVYFPSTIKKNAEFKAPAIVTTSTIFDAIPEWQAIKKRKLTK
ncbi:MAG: hypothetical protein KDB53_21415, partial [Planctomycetes bacterium]|nr:hypothetical protein [Planctomycetota bacterium]